MSFPGMPGSSGMPGGGGGGGVNTAGMSDQEAAMVKAMQAAMESCPAKTMISGGMGFALGGAFGLFMSSVSGDLP
ncbi:Mitochondrial import inner membrane translocase subunit tim22 [Lecanora helva]